jgi:hypothetical protein
MNPGEVNIFVGSEVKGEGNKAYEGADDRRVKHVEAEDGQWCSPLERVTAPGRCIP